MAERKNEPAEGPNGVDGWTSNGYGLLIDGKNVEPAAEEKDQEIKDQEIEEIEEA